jgi:hypothetical protein
MNDPISSSREELGDVAPLLDNNICPGWKNHEPRCVWKSLGKGLCLRKVSEGLRMTSLYNPLSEVGIRWPASYARDTSSGIANWLLSEEGKTMKPCRNGHPSPLIQEASSILRCSQHERQRSSSSPDDATGRICMFIHLLWQCHGLGLHTSLQELGCTQRTPCASPDPRTDTARAHTKV